MVLITGGAGFVGTNLMNHIKATSLDNYSTGSIDNHQPSGIYLNGDVLDIGGDYDFVYHLAALPRIQPSFSDPVSVFETNALGTMKVCDYCVEHGVPMVYAGSSSHHSGKYKNPYTFSKDIGEDVVTMYQRVYGLKATIVRFYNVYGPYQVISGAYATVIGIWENSDKLIIYGDGEKRRDFTHVDDIVQALILIKERESFGYIFELGTGKNWSLNEIADMFDKPREYRDNRPGEAQNTLCDNSLARNVLGWKPKNSLNEYIKCTI